MPLALKVLISAVLLAYPVLVYLLAERAQNGWLAGLLLLAASLKLFWRADAMGYTLWAVAAGLFAWSALHPSGAALLFYPVLANAAMLALFAISLWKPPTVIERLARLQEPDLPPEGVRYTRKVTWAWCVFFIINASISLATVLWGSKGIWAFYNGLLAYILMGLLGAGEWLLRKKLRQRHGLKSQLPGS